MKLTEAQKAMLNKVGRGEVVRGKISHGEAIRLFELMQMGLVVENGEKFEMTK